MQTKNARQRSSIVRYIAALNAALALIAASTNADPLYEMRHSDAVRLSELVKPGDVILITRCLPNFEQCKLGPYHTVNDGDLTARTVLSVEIVPAAYNVDGEKAYSLNIKQALFYSAKDVTVDKTTNLVSADGKCWIPTEPHGCFTGDDGGGPYAGTCKENADLAITYVFYLDEWKNMAVLVHDAKFSRTVDWKNTFRLSPNTAQKIKQCHQAYKKHLDRPLR
jgi:hypothetical protein